MEPFQYEPKFLSSRHWVDMAGSIFVCCSLVNGHPVGRHKMERAVVCQTDRLVLTLFNLFLSVASSDVCSRIRAVMTTSTWISLTHSDKHTCR